MVKKLISILVISALPIGFAGAAFSAQHANATKAEKVIQLAQEEKAEQCTVIKIEGNKVTLQNHKDKQFAVNVTDQKILQNLKAGENVLVKNGKIIKEKK